VDVPDFVDVPELQLAEAPAEGVEQHVRIVLPPPGPGPAPRPGRGAAMVGIVLLALAGGAAAGAVIATVTTSRSSQTVVEEFFPDQGTAAGVGDPQAILAKVLPAVVSIDTAATPSGIASGDLVEGAGTGMIITPGGLVLTNAHVIGGAKTVTVTVFGQSASLPARVVGSDPAEDVALVQIEGGVRPFPTVDLGDSSATQQGDSVLAIGNALALAGGPTVTEGIVSAEGRSLTTGGGAGRPAEHLTGLIQTDAPINPGNSGGPLVNAEAQVIGMNTAVAESSPGNAPAQDIGFAIAIDQIEPIVARLERQAHLASWGSAGGGRIATGTGARIREAAVTRLPLRTASRRHVRVHRRGLGTRRSKSSQMRSSSAQEYVRQAAGRCS
jgi:S1-C subfamily serine protease